MKIFKTIFLYLIILGVLSLNALTPNEYKFFSAIWEGDLAQVKDCVENLKVSVNTLHTDIHDQTALHLAARHGYTNIVDYLIKKGADVNIQDSFGRQPIHYAARDFFKRKDNPDLLKLLIKSGSHFKDDKGGWNPFDHAAIGSNNNPDSFDILHEMIPKSESTPNPKPIHNFSTGFGKNNNENNTSQTINTESKLTKSLKTLEKSMVNLKNKLLNLFKELNYFNKKLQQKQVKPFSRKRELKL